MKKFFLLSLFTLLSCKVFLFAQGNEIDAFTLSNTELGGTARSMAMGGAFGALGGDLSVIGNNPAGLGIYRSSEVTGTLDLSSMNTSTDWLGVSTAQNKTLFTPTHAAFSLYFPTGLSGVRNWSLGFSYNRLKNFKRSYRMQNKGQDYSMADFAAWRASNAFGYGNGITLDELTLRDNYDPYNNSSLAGNWLPIIGYESGMYDHFAGGANEYQSAFGRDSNGQWQIDSPTSSSLRMNENGYIDEYNIGFGLNISDFFFIGASVTVTDIDYRLSSFYGEDFSYGNRNDYLYLDNRLNTKGNGISANIGVIMNLNMIRLGVAYNSPRLYDMTDYFGAKGGTEIRGYDVPKMDSQTPESSYSEYRFRSPDKWIFSGALLFGQSALVSADYELSNYRKMLFSDRDGWTGYDANDCIEEDFTWGHTIKLGVEIKPTPQFALRTGYMMQTSPMREQLVDNDVEVLPAGTIPHFTTISNPTHYLTAGVGFRFNPNFYMDLAWVYRYNNSNAYAFSNTYSNSSNIEVFSTPAKLLTKTTRLALTLGYKF